MFECATWFDVKPELFGIFDQRTGTHQSAGDTPNEGVEQVCQFAVGGCRRTMESRLVVGEGISAVGYQNMEVDISCEALCYVK